MHPLTGRWVEVNGGRGETLLTAMQRAGIQADAQCGGNGTCGKCRVSLADGETVLACRYRLSGPVKVLTGTAETGPPDPAGSFMTGLAFPKAGAASGAFDPDSAVSGGYAAAVDLGTTTLAACLLAPVSGEVLLARSSRNPQCSYGADVISRAQYSITHGPDELSRCMRGGVRELLKELSAGAGIRPDEIKAVSVAGNTCMHHLFLGLDVRKLARAPHVPAVKEALILKAEEYQLSVHPEALLYMLPNIAGFVGGDTAACLACLQPEREDAWTLLADIGTNSEMALAGKGKITVCSAAAGPAFEGVGISCGMRAEEGAVAAVRNTDGGIETDVIGGGSARGICGSGLLDLIAVLLERGDIDEYGGLKCEDLLPVPLTQKDVRQFQLAKAAIAAGIECLLEKEGISAGDVSRVYLSGAFGNYLNPGSACAAGLFPEEFSGRIEQIGNASAAGAALILRSASAWEYAKEAAAKAEALELAELPEFQESFLNNINFEVKTE